MTGKNSSPAPMRAKSIFLVNNIPSPYRRALFDEVARVASERGCELSVLYLAETESVRGWNVKLRDFEFVLPVLLRVRNLLTTTSDIIINRGVVRRCLRPRHMILFGYNYPSYLVMAVTRAFFRRPTYLFCETTLHDKAQTAWKTRLKSLMFRLLFSQFLVPGRRSAEYLEAHGVMPDKIFLARNASPIIQEPTPISNELVSASNSDGDLRLLFVGRLAPEKRMLAFVQVFAELGAHYRLTIAGDGPEFRSISEIAQSVSNIDMIGHIDPSDLINLYSRHNVLVLVSESEPWGMVVNEAVNQGLALLLSPQVGSACELLDGNGTYIEDLTPDTLSAKLEEISRHLDRYCARSREIARETTVELQARAFLDCIGETDNARG